MTDTLIDPDKIKELTKRKFIEEKTNLENNKLDVLEVKPKEKKEEVISTESLEEKKKREEEQEFKNAYCSYMRLYVRCTNLANLDFLSKSDSVCSLFYFDEDSKLYFEQGKTDMMIDELNPYFTNSILINKLKYDLKYGENLKKGLKNLRWVVADVDDWDPSKAKYTFIKSKDVIGIADWKIQELIINNPDQALLRDLTIQNRKYGEIFFVGENCNPFAMDAVIKIKFAASDLPRMDVFSDTDPFFIVKRDINEKFRHWIYISEALIDEKDPYWKEIVLPLNHWCNGDLNSRIYIELWDWNSTTKKSYIGEFSATTEQLFRQEKYEIKKRKGRKSNQTRGTMYITSISIEPKGVRQKLLRYSDYLENKKLEKTKETAESKMNSSDKMDEAFCNLQ